MCFVVLYGVVGIEAVMLAAGGLAFMWATFALILLTAAGICAWMFRLLDDGAPAVETQAAKAEPEPKTVPVVVPAPERAAPAPGRAIILA